MSRLTPLARMIVAAISLSVSSARADDLATLSPEDLRAAIVAAVEGLDANALLRAMTEEQHRKIGLFADADRVGCEEVIALPATITDWRFSGTARQAYINAAKRRRLADGSCACLFKGFSFADFTHQALGKAPDALTDSDRPALREIETSDQTATESRFRDHELKTCGAN